MASVKIGEDLRQFFRVARTNRARWGRKLTQDEAAEGADVSTVTYRNLETGQSKSARVETIVDICEYLGIDADTLEDRGYLTVADELRMRLALGNKMVVDLNKLTELSPHEEKELRSILAKLAASPRERRKLQGAA